MAIELIIWGIAGTVVGGAIGVASALSGKQRSPYQAAIKITEEPYTSVISLPIKEGKGQLAAIVESHNALNETNHILCQVIEASGDIPAVIEFVETTNSFHSSQKSILEVTTEVIQQAFIEKKNFKAEIIATATLAIMAGKIITSEQKNGAWRIVSSAPTRSARAVLHSIPAFFSEYDATEQQLIRRAVIGEISLVDTTDSEIELAEWGKVVREHRGGRS